MTEPAGQRRTTARGGRRTGRARTAPSRRPGGTGTKRPGRGAPARGTADGPRRCRPQRERERGAEGEERRRDERQQKMLPWTGNETSANASTGETSASARAPNPAANAIVRARGHPRPALASRRTPAPYATAAATIGSTVRGFGSCQRVHGGEASRDGGTSGELDHAAILPRGAAVGSTGGRARPGGRTVPERPISCARGGPGVADLGSTTGDNGGHVRCRAEGPPDARAPPRCSSGRSCFSPELLFFGGLFAAYFNLRADTTPWLPAGVELEPVPATIGILLLVVSSFTFQAGVAAGASIRLRAMRGGRTRRDRARRRIPSGSSCSTGSISISASPPTPTGPCSAR